MHKKVVFVTFLRNDAPREETQRILRNVLALAFVLDALNGLNALTKTKCQITESAECAD